MFKTFPKSRICVIDIYPSFEEGLNRAIKFANKFNVPLHSLDGRRLITSYCISSIERCYKDSSSPYPKVLCIGTKPKTNRLDEFIRNYFNGIMKQLPFPYCGTVDINSPDLEFAAQSSLNQKTISFQKYKRFKASLNLRDIN